MESHNGKKTIRKKITSDFLVSMIDLVPLSSVQIYVVFFPYIYSRFLDTTK